MFTILYTGILTFLVMLLLHHLFNYLKSNLTIPKVEDIYTSAVKEKTEKTEKVDMKDELQDYLKQFKKQS
jgi:hypothetical protein